MALLALTVIGLTACGGGGTSSSGGESPSTSTTASASGPTCGAGTHKPATGKPIHLGDIVTKLPGVDFSQSAKGVEAYFECMNENGGIDGRPLKLDVEYEALNPQEVSAVAAKLLGNKEVLGMVGSDSLSDCPVNLPFYEKEGIYVLGSGLSSSCFSSPNFASTIGGPRRDLETVTQYLLDESGAESGWTVAQSACNGCSYFTAGSVEVAEKAGVEDPKELLVPAPITNPTALALQLASDSGDGGGVAVSFSGPELVKVLNAASQQNLQERVHWGCSGICSSTETGEALDPAWEEKIFAATNFPVPGSGGQMELLEEVIETYGGEKIEALSTIGMNTALIAGQALLTLKPDEINREGVNKAIRSIKGFETGLLCEPFTYGEHPVKSERIATLKDGKFVEAQGCVKAS